MDIPTLIDTDMELFSKIEFSDYDVLVPFICLKTGRCCKTYMPHIPEKDMLAIARFLRWSEEDTFSRYNACFRKCLASHPEPCIFLNKNSLCQIYNHPLRPSVCMLYPFSYRSSDESCPGYKEHQRLIAILTAFDAPSRIYDSSFCPNLSLRPIPSYKWKDIIDIFRSGKPSPESEHKFIAWNRRKTPYLQTSWVHAATC